MIKTLYDRVVLQYNISWEWRECSKCQIKNFMFPVISYSLLMYLYRLFQGYITSFFLFQGYICYTILYRGTKTAVYYFAIQQQHYRYTVTNKVCNFFFCLILALALIVLLLSAESQVISTKFHVKSQVTKNASKSSPESSSHLQVMLMV